MRESLTMETTESPWGGGTSPFAVSWQKLMMWLFIVTDALLFAGLLSGYGFVRIVSEKWPRQPEVFHLGFIAFMTFILISSSATMATAVGAARHGNRKIVTWFVFATILGGLGFLGCQVYEWASLILEGARLYKNPWGVPHFSASFFIITGFHGSHVFVGVIILFIVALRTAIGYSSAEGVELAGLYWHFVDLVWVFIFTLFYLV